MARLLVKIRGAGRVEDLPPSRSPPGAASLEEASVLSGSATRVTCSLAAASASSAAAGTAPSFAFASIFAACSAAACAASFSALARASRRFARRRASRARLSSSVSDGALELPSILRLFSITQRSATLRMRLLVSNLAHSGRSSTGCGKSTATRYFDGTKRRSSSEVSSTSTSCASSTSGKWSFTLRQFTPALSSPPLPLFPSSSPTRSATPSRHLHGSTA
mmetsp:Transcript_30464/g.83438  ORF Transcript_30464/g.83438 Transcript_30464/m.83438 type:complete len:221 (+) Transcript_30464:663-1325(+)